MTAYYNEHDPYASQWLRNLIAAGHIAPGDVDERSIEDVRPSDIDGYKQCHFFAGIGGWSRALRLAGWSDDRPVWTGSCPCQPFSAAGKRAGFADERHVWPAWHHLISQRNPQIVFGEQVASKDGYTWLDLVQTDMESAGYAFGPVVLPAAGVGAPHGRHRIFFVADASGKGLEKRIGDGEFQFSTGQPSKREAAIVCSDKGGMAYPKGIGREQFSHEPPAGIQPEVVRQAEPGHRSGNMVPASCIASASNAPDGFWQAADWLFCRDGKWRHVEPGTFPLAHGVANRMDKLRAYGNAIVPQVAEAFIRAYVESVG